MKLPRQSEARTAFNDKIGCLLIVLALLKAAETVVIGDPVCGYQEHCCY